MSKVLRNVIALRAFWLPHSECYDDVQCILFEYDERFCKHLIRLMDAASDLTRSSPDFCRAVFNVQDCIVINNDLENEELTRQLAGNGSVAYLANLTVLDEHIVSTRCVQLHVQSDEVLWRFLTENEEALESATLRRDSAMNFLSPVRVVTDRWKGTSSE